MKKIVSQFNKVYARQQKAERRNFQLNPTKRTGVHPPSQTNGNAVSDAEETSTVPTSIKLTELLIQKFEESIAEVPDGPLTMHIGCCGICKDTYYEWRKQGARYPDTIYGEFCRRIDAALFTSWKKLHQMAAREKPFEILSRRHPTEYPTESMRLQLSGLDGGPLFPTENHFVVSIEMHAQPEQKQLEEPVKFRIVEADGREIEWWE